MTLVQPDLPVRDICARRHRGSTESIAAFDRVSDSLHSARSRVLSAIQRAGARGLTAKELAAAWNIQLNTISGRFSELKRDGQIVKIGTRDGCGVYVAKGGAS